MSKTQKATRIKKAAEREKQELLNEISIIREFGEIALLEIEAIELKYERIKRLQNRPEVP